MSTSGIGQDTAAYVMSWQLDAPLVVAGALSSGIGFYGRQNVEPFTINELSTIEIPDFLAIDEVAVSKWSPEAQRVSDVMLITGLATPLVLVASQSCRKNWFPIALMYGETILLTYGVTDILKSSFRRNRPLVYNESAPLEEKLLTKARLSFPSGHTSMSAASFVFTASILAKNNKNDSWDPVIWAAGFTLPAVVGWLRIEGGKHYTTDVIAGYAIGVAAGFLIPKIHERKAGKRSVSIGIGSLFGEPVAQLSWSPR